MSDGVDVSLMDLFREEVRAHAATLGQGLLELEGDPCNPQWIEPLMRAAHSIKGAARIVNLEAAVRLAHAMEDALVAAQKGQVRIGSADVDLLLRGTDVLGELAQVNEAATADWTARHETEIARLQESLRSVAARTGPASEQAKMAAPPEARTNDGPVSSPTTFTMPAIPREPIAAGDGSLHDLFREEVRAGTLLLSEELPKLENSLADAERIGPLERAAHSIRGAARIVGIAPAAELAQSAEEVLAALREGAVQTGLSEIDALLRATALLAELIPCDEEGAAQWSASRGQEAAEAKRRLASLPRGGVGTSKLPEGAGEQNEERGKAPAVSAPQNLAVPAGALASVAVGQVASRPDVEPIQPAGGDVAESVPGPPPSGEAVVRVTAGSLNRLMGLAGESLVQARWLQPFATALLKLRKQQDHLAAQLDEMAHALSAGERPELLTALVGEVRTRAAHCRQVLAERLQEFEDHAAQAESLNGRLYQEVIVSRMRPFADGAHGFPRLVRDMARRLNKQVRLDVVGQATEVDRDVLDKLEAPLNHLLRNAVDHGIEPPGERAAAGKPETGVVRLEARHRAGMLAITVADDGGGIDPGRLRRKVVERGLATAEMAATLGEAELLEFLFLPGFSTAPELTEFSGRGVGLDVVQDTVRKIGGSVRIASRPGQGTTFFLQLPITLSVLRAVLVTVGGEPYAFPHNRIDRLVRAPRAEVRSLENRQFVTVDGQNVGLVLAAQLLELPAGPPAGDELPVLLLSDATGTYGLIVEAFRGEQDLVVRPLDPRLGKVPDVSAAAVLDDGTPVLIADIEDLIRSMGQFIQTGSLRRCERPREEARGRKRVLVVDDSITVREVERQLLRGRGYEVAVAVDGKDGWKVLQAEPFDLLVTDVDMPRMNGLELVRAVRDNQTTRELPVIVVSYKDREEDRLRGLEAGANHYLTKSSFHDHTFLQAVADLIGEA
jgi:two-component system sensor histidine kinase and response regulator WspE